MKDALSNTDFYNSHKLMIEGAVIKVVGNGKKNDVMLPTSEVCALT